MSGDHNHQRLARKAWLILFTCLFIGGMIGGTPSPVVAEPAPQTVETILEVVKTADRPTITLGEIASFAIQVTNVGPVTASNVRISDQMWEGMVWSANEYTICTMETGPFTCNLGDIAPGASVTVHVSGVTTQAVCGQMNNIATVTYNNGPTTPSNGASIVVNCPIFDVTVLGDHETITAGDVVGYTIEVANRGNVTENGMTLTDTLPNFIGHEWTLSGTDAAACSIDITTDVLSCDFGSLAIGEVKSVRVTSPTSFCGGKDTSLTITNTATASLDNSPYPPYTHSGTFNMNMVCPSLLINEEVGSYYILAGEPASYTIEINNRGEGAARNIEVEYAMPTNPGLNWSAVPTMPEGTTGSCYFEPWSGYYFLECAFDQLPQNESISVTATSPTTSETCNSALYSVGTVTSSNAFGYKSRGMFITVFCLALTVTADHPSINLGDELGFTIQVTNPTTRTVNGTTIYSNLPTAGGLTWSLSGADAAACAINANNGLACGFGSMGPGAVKTVRITSPTFYNANNCQSGSYTVTNSAFDEAEGQPGNNTASATTSILCPSMYTLEWVDNMRPSSGEPINLTIEAGNGGAGTAREIVVAYPLPTNTGLSWSILSVTKPDSVTGSCAIDSSSTTLRCRFDPLASGQEVSIQLTSPTTPATCGSPFQIAGTVTASNGGEYASMPTEVEVLCSALPISVTAGTGPFSAGDIIDYTIEVTNPYPVTIYGVRITDTPDFDAYLEWSVDQQDAPECYIESGLIKCNIGTLAPYATFSARVFAASRTATCGMPQVDNSATVVDSRGLSSSASDSLTVSCPDLALTKTTTTATITPTDPIHYDLTVTNIGQGTAREATLRDTLPTGTGFTWNIGGPDAAACAITDGVLICPFGDMAPGAVKTITLSTPTRYDLTTCHYYMEPIPINNEAGVSAYNEAEDATTVNNRATANISLLCPYLTSRPWTDAPGYLAGLPINLTVTITNEGVGTARMVEGGASLPSNPGLSWTISNVSPASAADHCAIQGSGSTLEVWCTFDQMVPNEQVVITLTSPSTSSSCGTPQSYGYVKGSNANMFKYKPHTFTIICPAVAPAVDQAGYTRDYQWSIEKTVNSNTANTVNDPVAFDYTVNVTQTGFTDSAWLVQGKISVTNPDPVIAISGLTVTAAVDNGGTCTVAGGTNVSIPAGGSVELEYTCTYATKPAYSGNITAMVGTAVNSEPVPFALQTLDTVNQSIDVEDSFNGAVEKINTDPIIASDNLADLTTQTLEFTREAPAPTSLCQEYTFTTAIPGTDKTASQTVRVCQPSLVTDSTLCTFDEVPATPTSDFRLILTPDPGAPNTFKLNASNPGQFYYNLFYANSTGSAISPTVTLTLPYPFVTQGAVPLHVYNGFSVSGQNGQTCLTPGVEVANSKAPIFSIGDWGSGATFGSTREIQIQLPEIPANQFFYANLHLDYGLKGSTGYIRGLNDSAISPAITIPNLQVYNFADSLEMTHNIHSANVFKKNPGIGGQAASGSTMNPVNKVRVDILDSSKKLIGTVYTDEDGWFMWNYKYTGKAATFYIKATAPGYSKTQAVTLKSNGFGVVNFLDMP